MPEPRWQDTDPRPLYRDEVYRGDGYRGGESYRRDEAYRGDAAPDPASRPPARAARRSPGPPARRRGSLGGRAGTGIVFGSAALGALITVGAGSEPGGVLGVVVIAGTAAAAIAVRPRAAYLMIPVPALAYVAAAIVAGLIHDRPTDTSHTALAVSAAQWIAAGFPAMTVATILAVAITAARILRGRRALADPDDPPPAAPRPVRPGRGASAPHRYPAGPARRD